jgi:DNA-binding CsgD family transcriptional regulator
LLRLLISVQDTRQLTSRKIRPASPKYLDPALNERDIQLLRLIADGLAAAEISERMGISRKGVEFHKTKLYAKISVSSALHATRWAIRNGYVTA